MSGLDYNGAWKGQQIPNKDDDIANLQEKNKINLVLAVINFLCVCTTGYNLESEESSSKKYVIQL